MSDEYISARTEEKLRDLTGVKKALSDIIGQAWDKGYKLGRLKASEVKPESSWIFKEISNGFGTFKRRACENCGHMRAQMPLNFCGYCGYKMTNVEEVEEEDGTRIGG